MLLGFSRSVALATALVLCAPVVAAPDTAQALFLKSALRRAKKALQRVVGKARAKVRQLRKLLRRRPARPIPRPLPGGRPPGVAPSPSDLKAPPAPAPGALPPRGPPGWDRTHGWTEGGVSKPGATAVLLVHGFTSSSAHFRAPLTPWNVRDKDYDPKATPRFRRWQLFALSPRAPRRNWFDELARTFKVVVWNQIPCMTSPRMPGPDCLKRDTFDRAYQTATWALRKLLDETSGPIALVGHSRGGLVARQLLKEYGSVGGRIRWFISLHAPHRGVVTSRRVLGVDDFIGKLLKRLPRRIAKPLLALRAGIGRMLRGGEEMALRGSKSLFNRLLPGERRIPGVTYVTFGGTSTIVCRLHRRGSKKTFDFYSLPGAPETRNGVGDLLVTDASAHLPWPGIQHISQPLHHFEVLWHKPTIERVRAIIAGGARR